MKMQKTYARAVAVLFVCSALLLAVASCATTKTRGMQYPVYVTNTNVIDLLAPEYFDGTVDSLYLLSGSFGGTSFFVQAFMQADQSGMFLTLLNDFGVDMGSMTYTSENLSFDSAMFPKSLKGQYIAIDMQFAFYKPEAIAAALQKSGLDFVVEQTGGIEMRKIMKGKKCIEEIVKTRGAIQIVNYLRGYEYNLVEAQN
ncbi:MAG: DUF3261 domain-containing protein [Treponema sp.]|nr:DUF3261 domain-containing protein [Treponema sp.]